MAASGGSAAAAAASASRTRSSAPARIGARTVSASWCGTASGARPQREVQDPGLVPEYEAEVDAFPDLADLVPDPMRDKRRLRVVEDDARLLIEPALAAVYGRDDGMQIKRGDAVLEHASASVEDLPLPCEDMGELCSHLGKIR